MCTVFAVSIQEKCHSQMKANCLSKDFILICNVFIYSSSISFVHCGTIVSIKSTLILTVENIENSYSM